MSCADGPVLAEEVLDRLAAEAESEAEEVEGSWISFLSEKDIAALAVASWSTLSSAALHFCHVAVSLMPSPITAEMLVPASMPEPMSPHSLDPPTPAALPLLHI